MNTPRTGATTTLPSIALSISAMAFAMLLGACVTFTATSPAPTDETPNVPAAEPAAPEPALQGSGQLPEETLRTIVSRLGNLQYSSPETIYTPPPAGIAESLTTLLAPEQKRITIASGVKYAVENGDHAAILFQDGAVTLLDERSCGSLILPPDVRPDTLAWFPTARMVGVIHSDSSRLKMFDRDSCAEIGDQVLNGTALIAAVSPAEPAFAVINEAHRMWLYRPGAAPLLLRQLRYAPLAVSFLPNGSGVAVVDQAGWLSLWTLEAESQGVWTLIQGGPFSKARFDGSTVILTPVGGPPLRWSLKTREFVPYDPAGGLDLQDGVLSYRETVPSTVKKTFFSRPTLRLFHNRASQLLRVEDIDGTIRHYSMQDGAPAEPGDGEWVPIALDEHYTATPTERSVRLADLVYQTGRLALYCRHIPEKGFYLWWDVMPDSKEFDPHHGLLPLRENIASNAPKAYIAIDSITGQPLTQAE